ncbi:MAG: cupin domain-containing protein [Terracidiphilus sp.]|jgi:quercetin dioxygenase-like cupin family protein
MAIPRRSFLMSAASVFPVAALHDLIAQSAAPPTPVLHPVGAGEDRFGHPHPLGFSSLTFKVSASDTGGNLFVIEHRNLTPGAGPALHLHYSQEEWFYVMESEVIFQVGDQRLTLHAGESVLAPRRIPHTFSAVGAPAHMLIAFTPADKMEQYFIDGAQNPSVAATADFMNRYDMQWIGPSPFWKS